MEPGNLDAQGTDFTHPLQLIGGRLKAELAHGILGGRNRGAQSFWRFWQGLRIHTKGG